MKMNAFFLALTLAMFPFLAQPAYAAPAASVTGLCGNGKLDTGEACDGQVGIDSSTRCSLECQKISMSCGNGQVNEGEECDGRAGVDMITQSCSNDCKKVAMAKCGNGKREAAEECDGADGLAAGQTCSAKCVLVANCGNGKLDAGEQCDGAAGIVAGSGAGCAADCKMISLCGNGHLDAGEECDGAVGIKVPGAQKCGVDCRAVTIAKPGVATTAAAVPVTPAAKASLCGNGKVDAGEECDGRAGLGFFSSGTCSAECKLVSE